MHGLPSLWDTDDHSVERWEQSRRPQILSSFEATIYGQTPEGGRVAQVRPLGSPKAVFGDLGVQRELEVTLVGPLGQLRVGLLLHVPSDAGVDSAVPVFLGLNFKGNQATTSDAGVRISSGWMPSAARRGEEGRRWPVAMVLERGYGLATAHYAEFEGDAPGRASSGVRGLFPGTRSERGSGPSWGALGAWAWGLSRMLDALQTCPGVDASKVIAHGHSRLGKAALWAAAQDRRFAGVVSNDSGCAGAALFRHKAGEDIRLITDNFPYWFTDDFRTYRDSEAALPVDQHLLLALLLPRAVHVASAREDLHADPRGEFLSTLLASPIAELYGHTGTLPPGSGRPPGADLALAEAEQIPFPALDARAGGRLSYHIREGKHDVVAADWRHFLDFADTQVRDA